MFEFYLSQFSSVQYEFTCVQIRKFSANFGHNLQSDTTSRKKVQKLPLLKQYFNFKKRRSAYSAKHTSYLCSGGQITYCHNIFHVLYRAEIYKKKSRHLWGFGTEDAVSLAWDAENASTRINKEDGRLRGVSRYH